jgi:hypothetical protein
VKPDHSSTAGRSDQFRTTRPEKIFDARWAFALQTISDPDDVEAESRELCQALIAAEGQIQP